MPTLEGPPPDPAPATREELIAMVSRAHLESAVGASSLAGQRLAAQSRLPKVIAENLGAGLGQWDFFPEIAEIVDFACTYVPPSTEEELYALARTWASDDAERRPTLLALVGREIMQHELRRFDVPALRELFEEARPARALALRSSLGLAVPAPKPGAHGGTVASKTSERKKAPVARQAPPTNAAPAGKPAPEEAPVQVRMPRPAFVPPPKRAPAPPPRRFVHPTFGEGLLEKQDGVGADSKLTIKFAGGSKTLLARFVTEQEGE
jgi:hypothetical protein